MNEEITVGEFQGEPFIPVRVFIPPHQGGIYEMKTYARELKRFIKTNEYLILNPNVQIRIREELDSVLEWIKLKTPNNPYL